jgi:hypothetical protein
MIAEVSYPSTGLGMELTWARAAGVPVLCLHQAGCEPSSSVLHVFSDRLIYKDSTDMVRKVLDWLLKNAY